MAFAPTFGRTAAGVLLLLASVAAEGQPERTFTAFSLRTAQEILMSGSGDDEGVRFLADITRPFGVIVDRKSGDSILLGERDPSRPALHLDDLVVALRSVFVHGGDEAPGVSIEPRGDPGVAEAQDVVYFGGLERTRFGRVCFEADYLMKRIGLGLQPVRTEGFESYFDLARAEARELGGPRSEVSSRFWFYPIVARVVTAGDGVFLDRCEIVVLTEILDARVDGLPVSEPETFAHQPAERFARSFSERLPELGQEYPILRDLENLTQLVALVQGLAKMEHQPDLSFWLDGWRPEPVTTPREVDRLSNRDVATRLVVHGGVYLQSLAVRLAEGDASAFTEVVLASRPGPRALSWSFKLTQEWQIIVRSLPGEADAGTASEYYARGDYLFQSRQYDRAIACWRQVAKIFPELPEIYYRIGRAFESKGLVSVAADYYTRALKLESPDGLSTSPENP